MMEPKCNLVNQWVFTGVPNKRKWGVTYRSRTDLMAKASLNRSTPDIGEINTVFSPGDLGMICKPLNWSDTPFSASYTPESPLLAAAYSSQSWEDFLRLGRLCIPRRVALICLPSLTNLLPSSWNAEGTAVPHLSPWKEEQCGADRWNASLHFQVFKILCFIVRCLMLNVHLYHIFHIVTLSAGTAQASATHPA